MRNNLSQLISLSKIEEKLYRPADAYEQSRVTRMEHVNTTIVEKPQEGIAAVAARIAKLINRREANGQKTVLSLASGRSMRDLFMELVRLHKEEGLSFKNVSYLALTNSIHWQTIHWVAWVKSRANC